MRKEIIVKIEYFNFAKSKIKHLCIDKMGDKWYEGMYYGFENKYKNIWQSTIRVNSSLPLLKQMRAFIHECTHLMLDFIWTFAFKLDMGRCDIPRHHKICYIIDKIVYDVLKNMFKREAKLYAKKEKSRNN